jgi:hypothetical protein
MQSCNIDPFDPVQNVQDDPSGLNAARIYERLEQLERLKRLEHSLVFDKRVAQEFRLALEGLSRVSWIFH